MTNLGLVANARGYWPSRSEFEALGVGGVRTLVYSNNDLDVALQDVPQGVKVVALLNSEHEDMHGSYGPWLETVDAFATRFAGRVHAVECGNELDLLEDPPELGARLVREARPILEEADMLTLMSSVAGPEWPAWLQRACDLSRGWYDGVCAHFYGQRPDGFKTKPWFHGELRDAIETAYGIADKPVWLTEMGVKIGDAGSETFQADYLRKAFATVESLGRDVVPAAFYFAWTDAVGAPHERGDQAFGLRDVQMRKRPAWYAFASLGTPVKEPLPVATSVWGGDPPPSAIFQLGFLDWANREPTLIGQPHDVAEFGAVDGISQQRTTRGLLTWADLKGGQVTSFLDATNGKRYVWDGTRSREVKAR